MEIRLGLCGGKRDVIYNRVYTDECSAPCCVSTVIQGVCLHLHRKKKMTIFGLTLSQHDIRLKVSLGGRGAREQGEQKHLEAIVCSPVSFAFHSEYFMRDSNFLASFFFFLETILK